MIEWALDSAVHFATLPAATQARFAARYDTLHDAWLQFQAGAGAWPDTSYNLIYTGDVEENVAYADRSAAAVNNAGAVVTIDITRLSDDIIVTAAATIILSVQLNIIEGSNFRINIHDLTIVSTQQSASSQNVLYLSSSGDAIVRAWNLEMHYTNTIAPLGIDRWNTAIYMDNAFAPAGPMVHQVWNCTFHSFDIGMTIGDTSLYADITATAVNITCYDCTTGINLYGENLPNVTVRNIVSVGSTAADYYVGWPWGMVLFPTIENCADSDGTLAVGTGNLNGIVPADEFASLTYGDTDFLRLKETTPSVGASASPSTGTAPLLVDFTGTVTNAPATGVLYNAGTTPTLSTTDLDGNTYGENGNYPIGCFQVQGTMFTPTRYEWDFNDGAFSGSQSPSKTYTKPKAYTATFTASNATASLSDTVDVTVYAQTDIDASSGMATHRTNKSFTLGIALDNPSTNEGISDVTDEQGV